MWELVLCWFGACNEFLGIGYFCVGVSVSQNRHIAIFSKQNNFLWEIYEELKESKPKPKAPAPAK